MSTLIPRDARPFLELLDWLEPPWDGLRPWPAHAIRLEECRQDGTHLVRAELPGLDPEHDIQVTITDGVLTIHAERNEEKNGKHRSEFRYGSFTRRVTLPPTADEDRIQATYDNGVLEVDIGLRPGAPAAPERHIPVRLRQHTKPA